MIAVRLKMNKGGGGALRRVHIHPLTSNFLAQGNVCQEIEISFFFLFLSVKALQSHVRSHVDIGQCQRETLSHWFLVISGSHPVLKLFATETDTGSD